MTTVVWDKTKDDQARFDTDIAITRGLDFILRHFKPHDLFPRNISTKATEGKQLTVFSKVEALAMYKQANGLDCKIAAYHSTNWRKGLCKLVAPDFLFIDLDLGTLGTVDKLDKALTHTLSNIKEKLGGSPTVIWSGNGYHVYQPVEAFILEQQDIFSKFEHLQPSRRLLQFAERYLSNGKMDECHNATMSLKNCMLRVPGSYNSKSETPKRVKIIQEWDCNRPHIKPLLYRYYIYMQDLRLRDIQKKQTKHWHSNRKFCPYRKHR